MAMFAKNTSAARPWLQAGGRGEATKGGRVKTNYILIDFENVQPKNLDILNGHSLKGDYRFKVIVFVGANQTKLPFDLVAALQEMGADAEYVKIGGNGNNALDFHIAYYVGRLAAQEPDAYFHIISKDTGFDPLIKHLKGKKVLVQREKDLSEIPVLRISNATSLEERIDAIVKSLAARGHARPRKVKTLANTIDALFQKTLEKAELNKLVDELCKRQFVVIHDDKISYGRPISQT
jgi:hypothetical protein